jgi:hypothetical protein
MDGLGLLSSNASVRTKVLAGHPITVSAHGIYGLFLSSCRVFVQRGPRMLSPAGCCCCCCCCCTPVTAPRCSTVTSIALWALQRALQLFRERQSTGTSIGRNRCAIRTQLVSKLRFCELQLQDAIEDLSGPQYIYKIRLPVPSARQVLQFCLQGSKPADTLDVSVRNMGRTWARGHRLAGRFNDWEFAFYNSFRSHYQVGTLIDNYRR